MGSPSYHAKGELQMNLSARCKESQAVREDRLHRNRLSAQKCRLKRKNRIETLEEQVNNLSAENAHLMRDNEMLNALIAKLQNNNSDTELSLVDSQSRKRPKYEFGVTTSLDSSESAVFATSLQMENFLLAVVTTALSLTIASTTTPIV